MTLGQIREQFVELSGRRDLARATNVSGSPGFTKRADFFIQAATLWLDENQETERSVAHYSKDLLASGYRMLVPDSEAITAVYAQEDAETIRVLEEISYEKARRDYGKSLGQLTTGTPTYYVRGIADLGPTQLALKTTDYTSSYTYEFGDTLFANESTPGTVGRYRVKSYLILPPTTSLQTITFVGKFYSKILVDDGDENYWSERRPELLIKASLRMLEGFYRNFEGVRDYDGFMASDFLGIEKALIESSYANINQMGG